LPVLRTKVTRVRPVPFKAPASYRNDHGFIGCGSNDSLVFPTDIGRVDYSRWQGVQTTLSETHPGWRRLLREADSKQDIGGEFRTERTWVTTDYPVPVIQMYGTKDNSPPLNCKQWGRYIGPLLPVRPSSLSFPTSSESSDSALRIRGTTAIARCKPTNPSADLSTFLGETLQDGLPKIVGGALSGSWKHKTSTAKAAGDEYLNAAFGWAPFVSDLQSLANSIAHAEKIIRQYERDAGKVVRRKYAFPETRSSSISVVSTNVSVYANATGQIADVLNTNKGSLVKSREETQRQWFSGAFTYFLPKGTSTRQSMARHVQEAKKLLGLSLTPDTVWNLTPWSWMVDWFSNAGDVISNISDVLIDGLVLRYGYMMEHTLTSETYTFVGPTGYQSLTQRPPSVTLHREVKKRVKATPYGFGLTWSSFTARQLAILSALGITRS